MFTLDVYLAVIPAMQRDTVETYVCAIGDGSPPNRGVLGRAGEI